MRKKLVSGLVVMSLSSFLAAPCMASSETSVSTYATSVVGFGSSSVSNIPSLNNQNSAVESKVSQDEALEIGRKAFNISKDIKNIQTSYVNEDYLGRQSWQFSWNTQSVNGYGGGGMVSVDSAKGTILDYNDFSDSQFSKSSTKVKSEQECAKVAENLAKTLVPEKFAQCKSTKAPFPNWYISGPQIYTFNWERQVNGIPFGENIITINVNAETGKVSGYHLVWDDEAVFPDPGKVITVEQAQQLFRDKIGLRLNYNRRTNPNSIMQNSAKQPVELFYSEGSFPYGPFTFVDALTGKLVDPTGKEIEVSEQVYLKPLPELPASNSTTPLSMQEAQAKLVEYFPLPQGYTIQSSQLNENWGPGVEKTWQFQLQRSDVPQDPGYSVSINAVTGELQNLNRFSAGPETQGNTTPKLDYDRCKQIASSFVAKACGKKADYLVLQESSIKTSNTIYYNGQAIVQPSYGFTFTRIVNGIPYVGNQVSLEVNNQTGEITSFYFNWDRVANFSTPVDLLTSQEAVDSVLKAGQTHLAYYRKQNENGKSSNSIGLTYRFMDNQYVLVDAKSGKLLTFWVEENPIKLSDIAGHKAEKEIRSLCTLGILDGGATKFNPDKGLTKAELAKMLVAAKGLEPDPTATPKFSDVSKTAWYYGWVETATKAGLVKGSGSRFNPEQMVTRQEMVVMMIRVLKLENTEANQDLLEESYMDGDKISPWAKDSYNLAAQMGLLTSKKGYLNPSVGATRGEAAIMLQRTIDRASRYGMNIMSNP